MGFNKLLNENEESILRDERAALSRLQRALESVGIDDDDARRFEESIRQLDELFLLVVAGEFNAGKSAFVNALLGTKLLEEGVTPTTERITVLGFGETVVRELSPADEKGGVDIEVIRAPEELLEQLNIVDTPGTNAINREHERLTRDFIPRADIVFFVTSADRPFTESERQFLERISQWGKKVVVLVNKADLLQTTADREEVLGFVRDNGTRLLGAEPRVIAVSAKQAWEARERGDEDRLRESNFPELTGFIAETLDNRERIRLKLLNPIGVGLSLGDKVLDEVSAQLALLEDDVQMLTDVEQQLALYADDQNRDFKFRLSDIDNALLDFENRGNAYFEETLRLGRIFDLTNKAKIKAEFESKVVADLASVMERRVDAVIDWMVASELKQWKAVSNHLEKRQEAHQERMVGRLAKHFDQDRQRLLETVGASASRAVASYDRDLESTRLAEGVRSAVASTALVEVGAMGIGALVTLIATTTATDITGILAAGAMSIIGLFILPAKRRSAKRELSQKVSDVRTRLMSALTEQFTRELDTSMQRIEEAMAPYSRFVRAEKERLDSAQRELVACRGTLDTLKRRLRPDGD